MQQVVGDRFVLSGAAGAGRAIDLASGQSVRVRFAPAGDRSAQMIWSDRAAELARLRHPMLNTLVDFGFADAQRTFEAYGTSDPLRASGPAGSLMLTHAVRFLESRGIQLTPDLAHLAVRDVTAGTGPARRRPLGVIVQPRAALSGLEEALDEASHGGTASIAVAGASGSGLRTLRTLASRAARLAGYVPICTHVLLRVPSVRECLWGRHVCVLLDEQPSAEERSLVASFLAELGTVSPRRHVVVRFVRTEDPDAGALAVEPMGVNALTGMIFIDRDCGPTEEELLGAARESGGRPGVFLERLRATRFEGHAARIGIVHESSAAYRVDVLAPAARSGRGIGRALRAAPDRAARLAERGRHASAIRLLTRVSRVLEGRGEPGIAAVCAERLAWIERRRGRSDRALASFERARDLANGSPQDVSAAIGMGIVWTDELRLAEAEAALRGARAAAEVLKDAGMRERADCALGRCLYWQSRHEEAGVILAQLVVTGVGESTRIEALALLARLKVARDDLRGAVAAATQSVQAASGLDDGRLRASAARTMAIVQSALGDDDQVLRWVEQGLRAAAAAHLPILGLRLRALLVGRHSHAFDGQRRLDAGRLASHLRTALKHRTLPRLVRSELEAAIGDRRSPMTAVNTVAHERSLHELQQWLELAHGAHDDHAALSGLCETLCERLRATSVHIVSGAKEPRTLARAGRPWQGDQRIVQRILAGGSALSGSTSAEPRQAAEPVRYGQQPIAVLCCRWTTGAAVDHERSSTLLRACALAAAAPVRSLLDRAAVVVPAVACGDLIGTCAAATALREAVIRAARAPFPVLIEGESGSGKELVARGIHRLSSRRDRRLCTVNCAALADDLLEAELFGHARGAFTGAVGERAGLFEEADGGTLFLDEVGELSPRAQAKLLRVLQDGEVRRVGENMPRRVDARIVAATNRRLDEEVNAGRYRADLRFRLDVVRIVVPPLRDRATDIPALALHFWADAAGRVGSSAALSPETLAALSRYDWPGNVRELQNAVASLAVHAPRRGRIVPSMLPAHIARAGSVRADTFEAARHEFERRFVRAALAQAGGQRARAARALGVSRQGLAKMLRRLQIDA